MSLIKRLISSILIFNLIFLTPSISAFAEETSPSDSYNESVSETISFLKENQVNDHSWLINDLSISMDLSGIIESVYDISFGLFDEDYDVMDSMINISLDFLHNYHYRNNDDLFRYLQINAFHSNYLLDTVISLQNQDGGFGLAKGYSSDIIDTKLALKALTDIGETEAMTNAALYISSLQNEDGGFGYQHGLSSNAYLSAEIADILIDTVNVNPVLSYYLEDTFTALDGYLDSTFPTLNELSASDLDSVYQHFYTALYRLKRDGRYDVTLYYDLQAEDGGVFDDPMATALFLELLVKEQNALVAKLDTIAITNDRGYAVSAFNSNENVNISVLNEYENEKAYLAVSIITPDGTVISLDGENSVWNTADYADGKYTVRAEIIRTSNDEVVTSLEQTFRIQHRLAVDSITLALSQPYSRVGDTDSVEIIAEFDISNFSEDNQLAINWTVTDVSGELIEEDIVNISEADVAMNSILLGSFIPDTSERNAYIIKAEIMSNDMQIAQTTTNYFVSDKSVAITYDIDKEYLTEIDDNANVTINLRDERVVDLIFTTSSEDTELIEKYAVQIEAIKDKLEKMGYVVNLSNVSTSYLSAKDTFAWIEYDHPNFNTQTPYTQHIVYDGDNIKMLGYTAVPYKDFLLVPDENSSQKIFNFDIQRDKTDWHSMNGGGFLFNTTIDEDTISGYYVLITSGGLRLYCLDNVNLNSFRNSSTAGTLMQTFKFSNVYDEHHIKIVADSNYISLWDDDNLIIDNYELPAIYGNGYGPITSHASHGCSQRSYFTFANITMQTITGEKLSDILDNYNFESQNSRYVINLSDSIIEGFDSEENINEVAQKISDKNICFIGLGNESNSDQYQNLIELIPDNTLYYDFSADTTEKNLSNFITDTEESKRVLDPESVVATDLIVTGELPDGTIFTEQFDILHEGETISFTVPVDLDNLTSGIDAVLLKNIRLDYTDENQNARIKTLDQITLPVIGSVGKITNQVSTDKQSYYQYESVNIFDRIHNTSDIRAAKALTNTITVLDQNGTVIKKYSQSLAEIMTKSYVEITEIWNVEDCPEGQYTIISSVYDGNVLVSESQTAIDVLVHELPQYELTGNLSVSDKLFKTDDTISITRSIENIGRYDIENGTITIKIIDTAYETVVYEREEELNLATGESNSSSFSVVPANDFASRRGNEYLITYEVTTEDGQIIILPGDGFMLDGLNLEMLGNSVLFSTNNDSSIKGIQMNGWLMNIYGGMHSNSNIEANCSIITVNGDCSSVSGAGFNTWQTILDNAPIESEIIELPDILSVIKPKLQSMEISIENGWTSESDSEFRIFGNNVTTNTDIYSSKSLVIDPSNFTSNTDNDIIICSEGDITIRSTDVNFKGIIYAPNGTVKIESNNFNIQGRIIAKNIVFQGSIFTGETYEGDLDLFNR